MLASVALVALEGCANIPASNAKSNAALSPTTGITRDLTHLPRPKARIPVAVYGFRDQTGQFKTSPESSYSTLVTQGAASILVKALEDSGWFTPVEREGLQNLLTERRIVRAIESPTDKSRPVVNLPNMLPASMIIEGGVIAYESNVRTGGKGASYLGIGASTQYRVDQVTVGLRSVDVRTGQILNAVSVTKTLYSYQFSASIYKFTSFQHLLQGETGYATNEPAQLAVREAIEAAVVHLTVNGLRDRYFELQDASQWDNPVIQAYLAEGLANAGDEPTAEDALIPMRPISGDRDAVLPLMASFEENLAERPRVGAPRAVSPSPSPLRGPSAPLPATAVAPAPVPATPGRLTPTPAVEAPAIAASTTGTRATVPTTAAPSAVRAVATAPAAAQSPAAPTGATAAPAVSRESAFAEPSRPAPVVSGAPAPTGAAVSGDIFNQYWKAR